ncbi:4194_t:CDS:2, partial [Funneliformis geosporum]
MVMECYEKLSKFNSEGPVTGKCLPPLNEKFAVIVRNKILNIPDDKPPTMRPRLIRVLDGEQVLQMSWHEKSEAIQKALKEPPKIIDNGSYTLGESDFIKFITSGTFVDKSLFIMEFMIYGQRANLITRPRRFGKTTNLSMLHTFLSSRPQDRDERFLLFTELKVSRFDWFMKLNFGKWPDLINNSWQSMHGSLMRRISDLYTEHRYILDDKVLAKSDEKFFKKILAGTTNESNLCSALSCLA